MPSSGTIDATLNPFVSSGDVLCPMCDYDLHGLTEPRCPECGFTFDWLDLTDLTRRKHKYLFEHHPDRNVWSFARTALGGLLPWRFWRSLRPEQPSNVRRLLVYWLLTVWGVFIVPAAAFAITCVFKHRANASDRTAMVSAVSQPDIAAWAASTFGSAQAYLDHYAPVAPSRAFFAAVWLELRHSQPFMIVLAACASFLVLPWAAALSLMLFQATMRRARVRSAHVLRCCLYSFDGGWWFGLLMTALLAVVLFDLTYHPKRPRLVMAAPVMVGYAAAAVVILGTVKLLCAYRMYMRFRHAVLTVFLALAVTWLLIVTLLANVPAISTPLLGA